MVIRINKKRIVTFFVTMFFLAVVFLEGVYAQDGSTPLVCPPDYNELSANFLNKYCCEEGSLAFTALNTWAYCSTGGAGVGSPAKGLPNGGSTNAEFCPDGNVWIKPLTGSNYCYASGEKVEVGPHKGEFFMGCESFVSRQGSYGCTVLCAMPNYVSIDLNFCEAGTAIFVDEKTESCICKMPDDTKEQVILDPGQSCLSACKDIGGVPSGSSLSNDPVDCTTSSGEVGVLTALGCIPTDSTELANWAILFGGVIGGVIAVFKIIQGSFMVMTSTGNPDKLQEGQSIITSALIGLVVIVGAVLMLNFFGYDVLGLGDFGFSLDQ